MIAPETLRFEIMFWHAGIKENGKLTLLGH